MKKSLVDINQMKMNLKDSTQKSSDSKLIHR